MDVKFFTIVLREITGQKFAIWFNINSNWVAFCAVVRRLVCETTYSGAAFVFLSHVVSSSKNVAKFGSKDKVY